MSVSKPTILCLVNGILREQLFQPATVARPEAAASIRWLADDAFSRTPDTWQVERSIVSIVLGSWGMPNFDSGLFDMLPGLRLIAHGAGTVKGFVTPEVFARYPGHARCGRDCGGGRRVVPDGDTFRVASGDVIPREHACRCVEVVA